MVGKHRSLRGLVCALACASIAAATVAANVAQADAALPAYAAKTLAIDPSFCTGIPDWPGRSFPVALNNLGELIGNSTYGTCDGSMYGFVWNGTAIVPFLPPPPPPGFIVGYDSGATDINDAGQVVGWTSLCCGPPNGWTHPFLYSAATGLVDLGSLFGEPCPFGGGFCPDASRADFVTESGEVFGLSFVPAPSPLFSRPQPFIYSHGVMRPTSQTRSPTVGVNKWGQQVSGSTITDPDGTSHAVPGYLLTDINNRGQLAADDGTFATLLTDTTPPVCTPRIPGGFVVADALSGLGSITVTKKTNANVTIAPFVRGTFGSVLVTAAKLDPTGPAEYVLSISDLGENKTTCARAV
jgi:probable HAF family extracellular repeat protein